MYEILFRWFRGAIYSNLDSHHEIPWEIGPLTPLSTRGHFLTCETYSAIYPGNRNRISHPMRWWSKMRKNVPKLMIITLLLYEKVTISPSTCNQTKYYESRITKLCERDRRLAKWQIDGPTHQRNMPVERNGPSPPPSNHLKPPFHRSHIKTNFVQIKNRSKRHLMRSILHACMYSYLMYKHV